MHGTITTPIPAELRSVATDGRAMSADGVYDYIINASQELINSRILTWYEGE